MDEEILIQPKWKKRMTTLLLTETQYQAIKQHNFQTGLTMGEFLRGLINKELNLKNEKG